MTPTASIILLLRGGTAVLLPLMNSMASVCYLGREDILIK